MIFNMNKWNKMEEVQPEIGKKALFDTSHGKYMGFYKGDNIVSFLEPIHFNGPITEPPIIVNKWRYITDKEYKDRKGYE